MSGVAVPVIATDRARLAAERLAEAASLAREVAPDVDIQTVALEGNPGGTLVRASENSRLLVVGSRGHGGIQVFCSVRSATSARCTPTAVLVVPALVNDGPQRRVD
jgi:nucleotide-binding universal stress UspA family protein